MMLVIVEGLAMCFLMLLVCVVGIANGPAGAAYYYEKDVQDRVVELGLITRETLERRKKIAAIALLIPLLVFVPLMVYYINGARGFLELFWQMTVIFLIQGLFDRLFIDGYWVGKTKAWIISGTEDLMPYIPKKVKVAKWIKKLVGSPVLAAILAGIISLIG